MRRVLFDENLPGGLRTDLPDLEVVTVAEAGWRGLKNGELLRHAEAEFDAFLTADRSLPQQQTVARLDLGIMVLRLGSTKLHDLRQHAPKIADALLSVQPGPGDHRPANLIPGVVRRLRLTHATLPRSGPGHARGLACPGFPGSARGANRATDASM